MSTDLDGRPPAVQQRAQRRGQQRLQGVGPELAHHQRRVVHQPHHPQLAQVSVAQLCLIIQRQADAQITVGGGARRAMDQGAGHAQVDDEIAPVGEREEEVLAPPLDALDAQAGQRPPELRRRGQGHHLLGAGHDLDGREPAADDVGHQVAADGLYFGELRHKPCGVGDGLRRRRAGARWPQSPQLKMPCHLAADAAAFASSARVAQWPAASPVP